MKTILEVLGKIGLLILAFILGTVIIFTATGVLMTAPVTVPLIAIVIVTTLIGLAVIKAIVKK